MVFSQTSHKTRSVLKVVEINRLKSEKSQQVGTTDMLTEEATTSQSPAASSSHCEEFVKSEPEFKTEMFHDSDSEYFQDLVQWCAPPVAEEILLQSIDHIKSFETGTLHTDIPHAQLSPLGWDTLDAPAPVTAYPHDQRYTNPLSPNIDDILNIQADLTNTTHTDNTYGIPFHEQFLDIGNLPVVFNESAYENTIEPWSVTGPECQNITSDTHYTNIPQPFIDQDDSMDDKFVTVTPQDVNAADLHEYIINDVTCPVDPQGDVRAGRRVGGLSIDVGVRSQAWSADLINTPEVLSCVEQLETETNPLLSPTSVQSSVQDVYVGITTIDNSPEASYQPITPKSDADEDCESRRKRRRRDSEDSDETYTPYTEVTPRKYKRRKPNVPIKEMIRALEDSQKVPKVRRGRPPKRRESVSSTISENSSTASTHGSKYRELRDKNNEASKRSRMNRKLKELQMEQLADELEERNQKLRVRADLLEEMTKKLRDAFMSAVAQKKNT